MSTGRHKLSPSPSPSLSLSLRHHMLYEVFPNQEPEILEYVESFGFKVFRNGNYNLNIIGVRNLS